MERENKDASLRHCCILNYETKNEKVDTILFNTFIYLFRHTIIGTKGHEITQAPCK